LLKPCSIRDIEQAISRALRRRQSRLRRQHLIRVMAEALEGLQADETPDPTIPTVRLERFLRYGPISLDREKRLVVVVGHAERESIDAVLTNTEVALLAYLMQQPETAFSSRDLARGALGYDINETEAQAIVRPHISRLRKRIESDPARPRLIRTIRGKGYILSPE
jgi:DNA-binding response OmpR family regulator